jgi:hypothetical protein
MTVREVRILKGRKGLGEMNFSQMQKAPRRKTPTMSMAIIYPDFHPFGAASAREKGRRKSAKPDAKRKIPRAAPVSYSDH